MSVVVKLTSPREYTFLLRPNSDSLLSEEGDCRSAVQRV